MSTLIIDRYLLVDYSLPRCFENISETRRRDVWAWDAIFIHTCLIFYCTKFARFISAGKFVKRSCQWILENSGNSNTRNVKDARHREIFCWRGWLLDGLKAIGAISLAISVAPLARVSPKKMSFSAFRE